uniref:Uncharacterized protein n=1 Tax=Acrobeloides nanus TaxID=290746 RepID=A0A914EQP9_9BILA
MGSDLCWIQDPRVAYLEEEDHMTYFMFYDVICYGGYTSNQHQIAFATNFNPLNLTSWNQSFEPRSGLNYQNPAVLFRTAKNGLSQHYLFFGAIDGAGSRSIEIGETFYVLKNEIEELFDLILQAHTKTEHGGRTVMENQLQGYSPIPREALQIYLLLYES